MGGVRTPRDPGETPRLRRGLENNAGCILQLIHPHPRSSEMIPGSPAGMSSAQRGPGIRGAMGVISRRTFCQRRDVAEGLGSWEQRPSLSGVLGGEKPWCQPHSCCAWPGRGGLDLGEYSPNGFKTGVSYKSNPHGSVPNWILGRIRGSATGPKVSIRSFPKPPARSRGEGSGPAPSCFHLSGYLTPKLSRCPRARNLPLE